LQFGRCERYGNEEVTSAKTITLALFLAASPAAAQAPAAKPAAKPAAAPAAAPAEPKPYTETVPGSKVTFEMIYVPGGKFTMGSPAKEKGRRKDEGPQHEVELKPFWMSKNEVTWDEYNKFLDIGNELALKGGANDESPDAITYPTPPYADPTFGYGGGNQPAIALTHQAVSAYARWVASKTGKIYRLPTEAEWEYACRAGQTTAYSFGDDAKKLADVAWYAVNSKKKPQPVGQKKPNPFGLFDMHGNTAEWVIDQYEADAYSKAKPGEFPVIIPGNRRYPHVVRGGGWRDKPQDLRCAARRHSEKMWSKQDPQNPQSIWWHTEATDVGFRLVRPVEEYPSLKGWRSKMTVDSPY
jgi:formylglycine-generating enzyme required for sulfatase activity